MLTGKKKKHLHLSASKSAEANFTESKFSLKQLTGEKLVRAQNSRSNTKKLLKSSMECNEAYPHNFLQG